MLISNLKCHPLYDCIVSSPFQHGFPVGVLCQCFSLVSVLGIVVHSPRSLLRACEMSSGTVNDRSLVACTSPVTFMSLCALAHLGPAFFTLVFDCDFHLVVSSVASNLPENMMD